MTARGGVHYLMLDRPERIVTTLDYDGLGLLGDYLLWCRDRGMRPRTIVLKRDVLGRVAADLAPADLVEATERDVRAWWRKLAQRQLADSTRGVYLSHVRAFYRWAMLEDLREDDPTRRIQRPMVRRGQPRDVDPGGLVEAMGKLSGRAWLAVALMALCGLRCAEAAAVRPEHLRGDGQGGYLLRVVGKGGHVRSVPVPVRVAQALLIQEPGVPVFANITGRAWTPDYMSHFVAVQLRTAGLDASAHRLRHTYATMLYRLTRDVLGVQRALGHASAATTQVYARSDVTDLAPSVELLWHRLASPAADDQPPALDGVA